MQPVPFTRTILGWFLLCFGVLAGCDEAAQPLADSSFVEAEVGRAPAHSPVRTPLTVMSRNLYHGGDIDPVLAVGFSDLKVLTDAAAGVWAEVQANDFQERVLAIADEIEEALPDVVGLQELARFVTLALNPSTGSFQPTGMIDFETTLEAELASRGLAYSFVATQDNTQVAVPVRGMETPGGFIPTDLVQLTVRDGVLLRDGLEVTGHDHGNYDAHVPLGTDPFGNPIRLLRGWIRVDVQIEGVPYHFVNTHLEIQSFAPFQLMQTEELLTEIVADLDGVTVMTGDFNSDAAAGPGAPSWTESYGEIRAAGFTDAWDMAHPGQSQTGFSCCQASDLRNSASSLESRIDFVFMRIPGITDGQDHIPGAVSVDLVGNEAADRTQANGLWPSDHAGVVAKFWLAPGQIKKLR